jgi:hypothetical protein
VVEIFTTDGETDIAISENALLVSSICFGIPGANGMYSGAMDLLRK